MLRVGLTGELGSGKSTVARLLAARGAHVFASDDMARELMQPGQPVFQAIAGRFGPSVLTPEGTLDRRALAALAFDPTHPRVEELNAIIHPAVVAEQARRLAELARTTPHAIVVVESAVLLTTKHAGPQGWRSRFDTVILVTAPEELKLQRFLSRATAGRTLTLEEQTALTADARNRLRLQATTPTDTTGCLLLPNDGTLSDLEHRIDALWPHLQSLEQATPSS